MLLYCSRYRSAGLGTANDKEVGLSLVRSWHSWNGRVNRSICHYKDAQSNSGRGLPTNSMALVLEIMQAAFIALCAIIIVYEARRKQLDRKTRSDSM
jgi:hypothetical protein